MLLVPNDLKFDCPRWFIATFIQKIMFRQTLVLICIQFEILTIGWYSFILPRCHHSGQCTLIPRHIRRSCENICPVCCRVDRHYTLHLQSTSGQCLSINREIWVADNTWRTVTRWVAYRTAFKVVFTYFFLFFFLLCCQSFHSIFLFVVTSCSQSIIIGFMFVVQCGI